MDNILLFWKIPIFCTLIVDDLRFFDDDDVFFKFICYNNLYFQLKIIETETNVLKKQL